MKAWLPPCQPDILLLLQTNYGYIGNIERFYHSLQGYFSNNLFYSCSIALALAFYYVISQFFGSPDHDHQQRPRDFEERMQPLPPLVQLGKISEQELKKYDGSDSKKPLLMAIKGQIYDVSQSW
ncbi:Membrane steroid-binding protein 2 [Capsicum annuum]|uniref:Membrane steroid-binding protein 2 n=1 Tax=Capsicum annuum TaxID=4072 RepID=A0A2G2ZYZ5_CAPAN|nr:Membrane steroid-binding protein 2 [Capsicum annuum]